MGLAFLPGKRLQVWVSQINEKERKKHGSNYTQSMSWHFQIHLRHHLQLMDYGYERYGATLTVRAKYDADQAKFLLLIADLKSDIYQKFGYITTIEPEIPAAPAIQEQVREIVCRKLGELDGNLIMAENTRVNKGVDRPQAVIYIFVPFSYGKREHEVYREVRNALEGQDFSYTVKLLAGNIRNRGSQTSSPA